MKTPKTYRLSPATIRALEQLKDWHQYEAITETDLVESAILSAYAEELAYHKAKNKAGD